MSISINYASQRNEVWQWYWRTWRRSLWKTHFSIFIAVVVVASLGIFGGVPTGWTGLALVGAIGILPLAGFVLFPMLKFKPEVRTLAVDGEGIATTIGKRSATIPWAEIADVREDGDALIIQRRNLNAFIVPARAFRSAEAKLQFRDFVKAKVLSTDS